MRFWIARIGVIVAALVAVPAMAQDTVPTSTQQINLTFAPVVKMVAPAVVNIYTKKVVKQQAPIRSSSSSSATSSISAARASASRTRSAPASSSRTMAWWSPTTTLPRAPTRFAWC
jgi:S1-C subfamily serine protease